MDGGGGIEDTIVRRGQTKAKSDVSRVMGRREMC